MALAMWTSALVLPYQWRVIGHNWEDPNARLRALVSRLESEGFQRVAGSYWVVLPITYVSDGRIPSAVTSSLPERYPELQRLVESSDPMTVPYVFEPWTDDPSALMMPSTSYTREEFSGYVLYLPKEVG